MAGKVNGIALAAAGTGALFLWSGIRGGHVLVNLQDLIQGRQPADAGANPITGTAFAGTLDTVTGPNPTGNQIAVDALAYQGHCYRFGGAPGRDGSGCWDCSSFANWVIGHDMGLAIPGHKPGGYDGSAHGPSTLLWLAWTGTGVTRIPRSQLAAGDLCVWQTHMGIAISNTRMISAQTPAGGTAVSGIDGFIPEALFCLRLKAAARPLPAGGGRKK